MSMSVGIGMTKLVLLFPLEQTHQAPSTVEVRMYDNYAISLSTVVTLVAVPLVPVGLLFLMLLIFSNMPFTL